MFLVDRYNPDKIAIVVEALVREGYLEYRNNSAHLTVLGVNKALDILHLAFINTPEYKQYFDKPKTLHDAELAFIEDTMSKTTAVFILIANYGYDILTIK